MTNQTKNQSVENTGVAFVKGANVRHQEIKKKRINHNT